MTAKLKEEIPPALKNLYAKNEAIQLLDSAFDEIYLVGGAVRDALLGKETFDLDFAVPDESSDIKRKLVDRGLKILDQGEEFGTIGTTIAGYSIQMTTYRQDTYQIFKRTPRIRPASSINRDLTRRDFTINSFALSRDGFIAPPFSVDDLNNKLIRCAGDVEQKINEDPVRILRAYRLVASLGFNIEAKTLNAIKKYSPNIYIVSSERVAEEFKKLMNGDYWSDAIIEMADSGTLQSCLKSFDVTYHVAAAIAQHIFDDYSVRQQQSMPLASRWRIFFQILNEAERDSGTHTLDIRSISEVLGEKLLLGKKMIKEVSFLLSMPEAKDESLDGKINRLTKEYEQLSQSSDIRQTIVLSKLRDAEAHKAFGNHQYMKAANLFEESLENTAKDLDHILDIDKPDKKQNLINIKYHYRNRYSYFIASSILSDHEQSKYKSSKELVKFAIKNYKVRNGLRLNKPEQVTAIDEAIVTLYICDPTRISFESFEDFVKSTKNLSTDRKNMLLRGEYYRQLKNKELSASEKASINLKIAKIVKEDRKDTKQLGFEYYEPLTDSLLWKTLCAKNLDDFWERFDTLEKNTDHYVEIAARQGRKSLGYKRAYLNAATALTHALSLATSLDSKFEITLKIIANFEMAGNSYKKNADRFKIFLSWFGIMKSLDTLNDNSAETIDHIRSIITAKSTYGYVDVDETFFRTKLSEMAIIRDKQIAVANLLGSILDEPADEEYINKFDELTAINTLVHSKLIKPGDAFYLTKNYCLQDIDTDIPTADLMLNDQGNDVASNENLSLIHGGESETVELKAGWNYSKIRKTRDRDISMGIIKTISAFMNTKGGKIFIGVEDEGSISGLEESDFKVVKGSTNNKKLDAIKLEIDNFVQVCIGGDKAYLLELTSDIISGMTILIIKVNKSSTPVYFKDKADNSDAFYVRSSSSTRSLSHQEAVNYCVTNFNTNQNTVNESK